MKKYLMMLCLFGCGFQPMFSEQNSNIYVESISGINGIELRNQLYSQFGGQRDKNSPYTLRVNLSEPKTKYKALERTGDATWQEIILNANYILFYNGQQIAKGHESASESYTFVRYLVAANASYNNAVANTIKVLADKIGARVITETYRYTQNNAKN